MIDGIWFLFIYIKVNIKNYFKSTLIFFKKIVLLASVLAVGSQSEKKEDPACRWKNDIVVPRALLLLLLLPFNLSQYKGREEENEIITEPPPPR
jgi:hypothetical protein